MNIAPLKKILTAILIVSMLVPPALILTTPRPVHAQAPVTVTTAPTVTFAIGTVIGELGLIGASIETFVIKEIALDGGIGWFVAKLLTRAISQSIINWINSGFHGAPLFVSDMEAFLTDIADRIVDRFVYGNEKLRFLCDPFQLNIRLALGLSRRPFEEEIRCTLSDVTNNIEGFFSGNFDEGGWPAWFQVTTRAQNNPYGAYLAVETALEIEVLSAQYRGVQKLNFGNGFLAFEVCDERPANPNDGPGRSVLPGEIIRENCRDETPGIIIQDQLSETFGIPLKQLNLADEINEIINALVYQIVLQGLGAVQGALADSGGGGSRGLGSLSRRDLSGQSIADRLSQISDEEQTFLEGLGSEVVAGSNTPRGIEAQYLAKAQTALGIVSSAELKVTGTSGLLACWEDNRDNPIFETGENTLIPSVTAQETTSQARIDELEALIGSSGVIGSLKASWQEIVSESEARLAALDTAAAAVADAAAAAGTSVDPELLEEGKPIPEAELTAGSETLANAITAFGSARSALKTSFDVFNLDKDVAETDEEIRALNLDLKLAECRAYPEPQFIDTPGN